MQFCFSRNVFENNTQHFSFYYITSIAIVMFYFSDVLPLRNGLGNILIDIFFLFIYDHLLCTTPHMSA